MENYQQDQSRRKPMHGGVDGFLTPSSSAQRRPAPLPRRLSQIPASSGSIPPMPRKPISVESNPKKQPKSLLNTTIPGTGPPLAALSLPPDSTKAKKKKHRKLTRRKVVIRSVLVMVVLFLGVGGFLGVRVLHTLDKVFHGNILSDVTAAFNDTPLKGESSGRVNILLAGDSTDDPDHGGDTLTDSILLLSIDTKSHTAFLLSIPRDLWVDIPGVGWQKINAANNGLGTNFPGYPQNGMGQLQHVVATDLGIPIDYYALSDYGAFKDAVNAVGGVTVDIQSPDPRGLYDPGLLAAIPNGPVALNGQEALDLARARGDQYGSYGFPDSDFDRTEHQRQIFTAITEKAKSIGVLTNPVKISDLFSAFGNNVGTDLTLQNVLRLVQITKGIDLSKLQSYSYCSTLTLGQNGCSTPILTDYTDPSSGQEALIPESGIGQYGQLQEYYDQLTSNNPIVKEGASVAILNASDVVGLAKSQETSLQSQGFNVATIADAYNLHATTMIVDNSGGKDPNSLKLLQKLYPGTTVTTDTGSPEAVEAQGYTSTFVVILGQNWDSTQKP